MNALSPTGFTGTNARPSARAMITERRTYLRPLDEDGLRFETPAQMLDRVISHQRWLWENQIGRKLNWREEDELLELRLLMEASKVSMSGRVKWMGGTELVKERASAAFNCSFTNVLTPADLVDVFWLLLQGCGVGFKPIPGLLTGFSTNLKTVEIVPSFRKDKGGEENNAERYDGEVWTIVVGDSAKAWAKALGKIMSGKYPASKLRIVLTELRPGGKRLKGYGWLSSGWEPLARALEKIGKIMMDAAGRILTAIEIGDIVNLLGTVLSSRRSAQIWLLDDTSPELEEFIDVKVGRYDYKNDKGEVFDTSSFDWSQPDPVEKLDALAAASGYYNKKHREQSNNSILFWSKPTRSTIIDLLTRILAGGDPGFINAREARRRAPDFEGGNPCAEILLPSKGFCNLVQVVWHRFNGDLEGLLRAQYLAGRANYRQTCVSMRDGVLQLGWNDNQHLLRLCGVAPLGYVSWEGMNNPEMLEVVRDAAIRGADSMADQFGTPRSRRVTQVQPGGTSSKHMGLEGDEVHEGAHLALSRWIFNNMNISRREPLVDILRAANYHITPNPVDPEAVLVRIPVEYPDSPLWTKKKMVIGGREEEVEINTESAVSQLERYRMLMQHYVQHNCSITVSFDETEIEAMADWFMEHWDSYVGISFLRRNDPTKTAADLGFSYLPQETVSRQMYEAYVSTLLPVDLSGDTSMDMIDDLATCSTGACPIR